VKQTRDVPFWIGGYVGTRRFAMFAIRGVAELAEHLWAVDLYICPKCESIRLFANQRTKKALLRPS
jgi:hypothetical protein